MHSPSSPPTNLTHGGASIQGCHTAAVEQWLPNSGVPAVTGGVYYHVHFGLVDLSRRPELAFKESLQINVIPVTTSPPFLYLLP